INYFFFQAEDGIRYFHVTGVQTCALPISISPGSPVMVNTASLLGQISPAATTFAVGFAKTVIVAVSLSVELQLLVGLVTCSKVITWSAVAPATVTIPSPEAFIVTGVLAPPLMV